MWLKICSGDCNPAPKLSSVFPVELEFQSSFQTETKFQGIFVIVDDFLTIFLIGVFLFGKHSYNKGVYVKWDEEVSPWNEMKKLRLTSQ